MKKELVEEIVNNPILDEDFVKATKRNLARQIEAEIEVHKEAILRLRELLKSLLENEIHA